MANRYPLPIQRLIDEFAKLPTVGPKTAERYVFYLLRQVPADLNRFSQALAGLKQGLQFCSSCFRLSDAPVCSLCADPKRKADQLCLVADDKSLLALEATGHFAGVYFVLGGVLNAIEGIKPDNLRIKELAARLALGKVKEVILAFNPDMAGETTALYLARLIKQQSPQTTLSRLARGLPMGSDLEYADDITLENALKYRNQI